MRSGNRDHHSGTCSNTLDMVVIGGITRLDRDWDGSWRCSDGERFMMRRYINIVRRLHESNSSEQMGGLKMTVLFSECVCRHIGMRGVGTGGS
jgi:hypothetical protein